MRAFLEIALTGVAAVTRYPLRSVVTVLCLCSVLVPYTVGMAISQGIEWEALVSINQGADLYVSGLQFGHQVPLPLSTAAEIEAVDSVSSVAPRIVGEVLIGKEQTSAVLVGLPVSQLPNSLTIVDGQLPVESGTHELVVGSQLARRLNLAVGDLVPPFYSSSSGEHVSRVVGVFESDAPFWQSNLVFTTFETASLIFDQPRLATDFLVQCREGYASEVRQRLMADVDLESDNPIQKMRLRVVTREDMLALLPRGLLHREGLFNLHYLLLAVCSILVVLVTSGLGLTERSREIGILKATGWQTYEVLLRSFTESFVIALTGAFLAIAVAFVWLRFLNGWWLAGLFIAGADSSPAFTIPYRLAPTPVMLTIILSVVIVMTGSLYSAWRAAVAAPNSVMR